MGFRISHASVMAQANAIAELANDLQFQINRLNAMEQNLRTGWRGQAANAFYVCVSDFRTELNQQRQQMADLAITICNDTDQIQ